jgi:ATP-dependent Clp protease ATP-binding subunit ClpA
MRVAEAGESSDTHGMFEHFSDRGRRVAVLAQEEARCLGDPWIGDEHLFWALAANSESEASQAFTAAGPTPAQIHDALASSHISSDEPASQNLLFNAAAKRVLERARHLAFGEPGGVVTTAHILEGTLATPSTRLAETLIHLSVNRSTLLDEGRRAHRADTETSSPL